MTRLWTFRHARHIALSPSDRPTDFQKRLRPTTNHHPPPTTYHLPPTTNIPSVHGHDHDHSSILPRRLNFPMLFIDPVGVLSFARVRRPRNLRNTKRERSEATCGNHRASESSLHSSIRIGFTCCTYACNDTNIAAADKICSGTVSSSVWQMLLAGDSTASQPRESPRCRRVCTMSDLCQHSLHIPRYTKCLHRTSRMSTHSLTESQFRVNRSLTFCRI
jgi:hypothetical protein